MRVRRSLTGALLGAALLVAGVVQPTMARADGPGWDDVHLVSSFTSPSVAPNTVRVAASGGRVLAVWTDAGTTRDLWVAQRTQFGDWQAPVQLSDARAYEPVVALATDGSATVAWMDYDGIGWQLLARSMSAAGVWGTTTELTTRGERVGSPSLAVSAGGTYALSWLIGPDYEQRVVLTTRTATTGWAAPITVSTPGHAAYSSPAIAFDAGGTVIVAWLELRDDVGRIRVARKPPAAALGGATTLAEAPSTQLGFPAVTVAPSGEITVGWRRDNSGALIVTTNYAATYAAGRWEAPVRLAPAAEPAPYATLRLASTGDRTIALWGYADTMGQYRIAVAERAAGRWGAPRVLSDATGDATMTALTALPSGHAVAVWDQEVGTQQRVVIATRSPGGSWSKTPLSAPQQTATYPQVALTVEQTSVLWLTTGKVMERATIRAVPYDGSATATGKRRVGSTLTCRSAWAGALSVAYEWRRGSTVVGRSRTYVPTPRDFRTHVACRSVATNSTGVATALSDSVRVVRGLAPVPSKPPRIKGTPQVGHTLRVATGRWTPAATVTVTWKRGKATIGLTRKHHVSAADNGHKLRAVVRATAPAHTHGKVVLTTRIR